MTDTDNRATIEGKQLSADDRSDIASRRARAAAMAEASPFAAGYVTSPERLAELQDVVRSAVVRRAHRGDVAAAWMLLAMW